MNMVEFPLLARLWFCLSAPVVLIDTVFVLTRSGSLDVPHPLASVLPFNFWVIYANYDRRYAPNDDAFVVVQSWLNVVEVFLGLSAVLLAHRRNTANGIRVALIVSVMTLYKTVLYLLLDVADGGSYTRHNALLEKLTFVLLPSFLWIIVPGVVAVQCMRRLSVPGRRIVTAVPARVKRG